MIISEIYVPIVDKQYEFKLDEDVLVNWIIEEIVSVICQKEQFEIPKNKNEFILYSSENKLILSKNISLYENGINTGDRLVLV